jgi:hypothetical protein
MGSKLSNYYKCPECGGPLETEEIPGGARVRCPKRHPECWIGPGRTGYGLAWESWLGVVRHMPHTPPTTTDSPDPSKEHAKVDITDLLAKLDKLEESLDILLPEETGLPSDPETQEHARHLTQRWQSRFLEDPIPPVEEGLGGA